jgi:hypothetical protein
MPSLERAIPASAIGDKTSRVFAFCFMILFSQVLGSRQSDDAALIAHRAVEVIETGLFMGFLIY